MSGQLNRLTRVMQSYLVSNGAESFSKLHSRLTIHGNILALLLVTYLHETPLYSVSAVRIVLAFAPMAAYSVWREGGREREREREMKYLV